MQKNELQKNHYKIEYQSHVKLRTEAIKISHSEFDNNNLNSFKEWVASI